MHGRVRPLALDDAEHGARLRVDDRERVGLVERSGDARGGVVACRPRRSPPSCRFSSGSAAARSSASGPSVAASRSSSGASNAAERHVPVEDARVRVVEDRRLDAAPEQRLGLAHEVLVERVLARDEHGEPVAAPAGPAPLLAQARDGPGEADRDGAVEQADVDAELERVRRGDAEQLALHQPALDLAPLRGGVPGAVGREARRVGSSRSTVKRWMSSAALRLFAKQIVRSPRSTKPAISRAASPSALARRPSSASMSGGFQSATVRSARGAASSPITVASTPSSDCAELARVRDRRRREQELRLGAVDRARGGAAGAGRSRRASRRRRGRRAPRRRRRSGGSRARRPSGRGAAGRRRGACPGS